MTEPPTIPISNGSKPGLPWKLPVIAFLSVFLTAFTIDIISTCFVPDSYVSSVRLKLDFGAHENPDSIKTQINVILSQAVLEKVSKDLKLDSEWGRRYFNGEQLKDSEVLEILKQRLGVLPFRDSTVVRIDSYNDRPVEAAQIANGVANAYSDLFMQSKMQEGGRLGGELHSVEILDQAQPPDRPCKPNRPLNILLGAIFGAFFGAAAAGLALIVNAFVTDHPEWFPENKLISGKKIDGAKYDSPQPRINQRY